MKRYKGIALLALILFLPSCLSWFLEKPTFNLKEVAITRVSLLDVRFLFGVEVQNPNTFDLKLRSLGYTIYFNDQEIGSGSIDQEVLIAQSATTLVQLPLRADFRSLGNPFKEILSGKDLQYRIDGAAIVKAKWGTATIPFSKSGEIKVKKP